MMRAIACSQASCGVAPARIASTARRAPSVRNTVSPRPVQMAPPMGASTKMPAPMMGESPTRPCILYARPLVVDPAAIDPWASSASIEMVSWFSMLIFGAYLRSASHARHCCSAAGVNLGAATLMPHSRANCSAPSPTRRTCGVRSITNRASEIGCATPWTNATHPARPSPCMTAASSVTRPSRSGREPRPTVMSGQSSSTTLQPASTASSAER